MGCNIGFRIYGSGVRVGELEFRIFTLGFRVAGLGS